MTPALRNRLYNCFLEHRTGMSYEGRSLTPFATAIVDGFFKLPIPQLNLKALEQQIADLYMEGEWFRVYDFVEFVRNRAKWFGAGPYHFETACNKILEEELSGYRFVKGLLAPVSSPVELEAIEKAINGRVPAARQHLQKSLELLAARPTPNCAKSISEAISSIEAMLQDITGDPRATLGRALNQVKPNSNFHPDLLEAFKKLYHWTSDDGGIRHAFKGQAPDRAIAKFMLVSCSAFVNYLEELRSQD